MLTFIGVILIAANIICAQPMVDYGLKNEEIGRLPEVVITAQRFEGEDIAYSGMLPEIVVTAARGPEVGMLDEVVITAPRYEGEDIAYSGMMPQVLVTASRYAPSNLDVTLISILKRNVPLISVYPELVLRANFRSTGYLN